MPVFMSIGDGDENDEYGPFPDQETALRLLAEKGFQASEGNSCWTKKVRRYHLTVSLIPQATVPPAVLLTAAQFMANEW